MLIIYELYSGFPFIYISWSTIRKALDKPFTFRVFVLANMYADLCQPYFFFSFLTDWSAASNGPKTAGRIKSDAFGPERNIKTVHDQ